jgi:hypothetical protein
MVKNSYRPCGLSLNWSFDLTSFLIHIFLSNEKLRGDRNNSADIVTELRNRGTEESGFDSRYRQQISSVSATSRYALLSTEPTKQWVPRAIFPCKSTEINLPFYWEVTYSQKKNPRNFLCLVIESSMDASKLHFQHYAVFYKKNNKWR